MNRNSVDILTIMLSWNRAELLEQTIKSYIETVSVSYTLIVVDNASNSKTILTLKRLAELYNFKAIFLKENKGGLAFNHILNTVNINKYRYIHFSENDLEYRPGWDKELISKLETFPKLGQISPYSLTPEVEQGEIWGKRPGKPFRKGGKLIYICPNTGTTCLVKKILIKRGLRWKNIQKNKWKLPADAAFSAGVKRMGYFAAWNDRYLAKNWGHNITQFQKEIDYYVKNYSVKSIKLKGFIDRLRKHGYKLIISPDKTYKIKPINKNSVNKLDT
ncbi:glycosyltransferase [Metabacillus sediminilitoris]|uniref:Glycosyltransferase n=1 Tax=Metabacillus sediminilitoris TaxID=2567941 RepID=A0A4S4BUZ4_9BACI|nr:glycosyltransferase [Metabacillus sediminilitoris]QGQ44723.1 glycosyltransferase [Metabacillus sediminilitoris]THF78929.1 glycosyltransferase [Metabacillus sediminilitoris]